MWCPCSGCSFLENRFRWLAKALLDQNLYILFAFEIIVDESFDDRCFASVCIAEKDNFVGSLSEGGRSYGHTHFVKYFCFEFGLKSII